MSPVESDGWTATAHQALPHPFSYPCRSCRSTTLNIDTEVQDRRIPAPGPAAAIVMPMAFMSNVVKGIPALLLAAEVRGVGKLCSIAICRVLADPGDPGQLPIFIAVGVA